MSITSDHSDGQSQGLDQSGRALGAYRLVRLIGRGGMGEVYEAVDTRLDRTIAIKLLRGEVVKDATRKARFEREAKALAALKHPGIVTIYAIETIEDLTLIAMEFVQGRTLTELLKEDSRLSVDRVIELALPIADALSAAHKQGILHRDVKPDNIIVGSDNSVTVLDFGLSKLASPLLQDFGDDAETQLADGTVEGRILGTVQYMSPEQAQGMETTTSTDVFSLGVVLYEMATGTPPFEGNTTLSRLSSMLKDEPQQIRDLNAQIPEALERVVRRCLTKDPDRRWQTATDVRNELEIIRDQDHAEIMEHNSASRKINVVAAILLLVVAVAAYWAGSRTAGPEGLQGMDSQEMGSILGSSAQKSDSVSIMAPPGHEVLDMQLSPDGRTLAMRTVPTDKSGFASHVRSIQATYFLRALDTFETAQVPQSSGSVTGRFSPDGLVFVFATALDRSGDDLNMMRMEVGSNVRPVQIGTVPQTTMGVQVNDGVASVARGFCWLNKDTLVLATDGDPVVKMIDARNGDEIDSTPLKFEDGQRVIRMLGPVNEDSILLGTDRYADGRYLQEIHWANVRTGETGLLITRASNAEIATDRTLVFSRGDTLYAVSWDKETLQVIGDERPVLSQLRTLNTWDSAQFQLSRDGAITFLPGGMQGSSRTLWRKPVEGPAEQLPLDAGAYEEGIAVSGDGETILLTTTNLADGMWSVSKATLSPPRMRSFIEDSGRDVFHPVCASNGTSGAAMTHTSWPSRQTSLISFDTSGGGQPQTLAEGDFMQLKPLAIRGDEVVFSRSDAGETRGTLEAVSTEAGSDARVLVEERTEYIQGSFSPDGGVFAWISTETGRPEAYVAAWTNEGLGRVQLVSDGAVDALGWVHEGGGLTSLRMLNDDRELSRAVSLSGSRVQVGPLEATGRAVDSSSVFLSIDLDGNIYTVRKGVNEVPADRVQMITNWTSRLE